MAHAIHQQLIDQHLAARAHVVFAAHRFPSRRFLPAVRYPAARH